jgi:hypothetical protein
MKNTHRDPYTIEHVQERLLLFLLTMAMPEIKMVFLSSLRLSSTLLIHNHLKIRYENLFYLRGSSSSSL